MATKKNKSETSIVLMDQPKAAALFESVAAEVSLLVEKVKAITTIETAEQATAFTEDAKKLKDVAEKAEGLRKDAKAPFLAAGKEIDNAHASVFDAIDKVLAGARGILSSWNRVVADNQRKADEESARKRAEEDRKKALAQTEIGQAGVFLVEMEKACIEQISVETTRGGLSQIWKKHCADHTDTSKFGALSDKAQGVLNRIIEFGKEKDAVLIAPSPEKGQVFTVIASKARVAAQNAEREIFAAVEAAQHNVEIVAETAKSEITQEQIQQHQQTETVATRRSPIKYRVLDITLVPAEYTMTVIDHDKMTATIKEHGAAIDANPHICPGIEFYREETVKL